MLHDALDLCTGPATIRWSKTAAPSVADDEVGSGLSGRKVRDGRDVCILAVGKMLAAAQAAADALAAEGIEATVWDVRVVPLDPEMLADAADAPGRAHGRGRHPRRRRRLAHRRRPRPPRRPHPQGPRAGHPHRVHPARQARPDPRRPRPRRRRPGARSPRRSSPPCRRSRPGRRRRSASVGTRCSGLLTEGCDRAVEVAQPLVGLGDPRIDAIVDPVEHRQEQPSGGGVGPLPAGVRCRRYDRPSSGFGERSTWPFASKRFT